MPTNIDFDFTSLSFAQRLELVEELIATIRAEAGANPFTFAEVAEMTADMDAIKSGTARATPWAIIRERLLATP